MLTILNKLGISVGCTTIYKFKKTLADQHHSTIQTNIVNKRVEREKYIRDQLISVAHDKDHNYTTKKPVECRSGTCTVTNADTRFSYYAAGDNVDVSIVPSYMTSIKQRKVLHWFMTLGIEKRVFDRELPDDRPKHDISTVSTVSWLPSTDDLSSFEKDLDHHILQVLLKFKCMAPFVNVVRKFILHPYVHHTSQPTEYQVVELNCHNENTSGGMINIMKEVRSVFVPRDSSEHPSVLDTTEFAGDVLTNERSLSAQECMMNNAASSYEKLLGLNYRPGGLHTLMNLHVVPLT